MNVHDLLEIEDATGTVVEEYWAKKGEVDLYLIRKFLPSARAAHPDRPVLFLVHGSSFSARTSYDLAMPGMASTR